MAKIKSDQFGLYVTAGGWKCRPLLEPTTFTEGQEQKTYHFGGSVYAGVGKTPAHGRGKYVELWVATIMSGEKRPAEEEREKIAWYSDYVNDRLDLS